MEFLSSDGATLVYTKEDCTSQAAASAYLEQRLAASGAPGTGYRVLRRWAVGEGVVVEVDLPSMPAADEEAEPHPRPGRFTYYWLDGARVRGISGPSKAIILELFAAHPDDLW